MRTQLISNKILFELEQRIQGELQAEYMYTCLSAQMQNIGFIKAAQFFLNEAKQEKEHAQILIDYCNDLGVVPNIIPATPQSYEALTITKAFKIGNDAENFLYKEYKALAEMSMNEDMGAHFIFMKFVKEQLKAVGEYGDYLATLNICAENPAALLQFEASL